MIEERKWQLTGVTDPLQSTTEGLGGLGHRVGTIISHFAALDIAPNALGGIEVGRIAWQIFDGQPVALAPQEVPHRTAAVSRQVVPHQDHALAVHETTELFEESDEGFGVETAVASASEETRFGPVPLETESCGHGSFLPVIAACLQDRGFAARRPGGADRGLLGEARFVLEVDPGLAAPSVFFTSGQRRSIQ